MIRPVHAADVATLREIDREGLETYRSFAGPDWEIPSTEVPVELIASEGVVWLAAERDGAVLGHVLIVPVGLSRMPEDDPRLAHLMQLFVRPAEWGTGVARELHDEAVGQAAMKGYERARLFCAEAHARARRFYEREGWRTTGRTDDGLGIVVVEYVRDLRGA